MAKPYMEVGRYGSVGLELVLTILIPAGIGHWLDGRYWGHGDWGGGVGFVIGMAVGFRNLVRTANGMQRDIERAEAKDPEAGRWTVDKSWVHSDPPGDERGGGPGDGPGDKPGVRDEHGKQDDGKHDDHDGPGSGSSGKDGSLI